MLTDSKNLSSVASIHQMTSVTRSLAISCWGEKNDRQILIWWLICGACLTKTLESADPSIIPARLTATRPMSRSQPRASSNTLILLNYQHVERANGFPFPPPPPRPLSAAGYLCTEHKKRRARGSHRHTQGGPRRGGAADSLRDPREDITGLYFVLSISKSRTTYFKRAF